MKVVTSYKTPRMVCNPVKSKVMIPRFPGHCHHPLWTSLSPKNQKKGDLSHLGDPLEIFCGNLDEQMK